MTTGPAFSARTSRLILIGLWLACCASLTAVAWHFIVPMNFRDPDDALRLVQVRDLIAGQSWFDLTQYRIHPPAGTPMHWSRLVDAPIALILLVLNPLLGAPMAERVMLVVWPLLLLLGLTLIVYRVARQMALDRGPALLAVALLLTTLSILIQFTPMRIDHHGTQMIYGLLAVWATVRTDRFDGLCGLLAGAAMAAWLQVSAEGVPYAVFLGAVFGVRHMLITGRWRDVRNYVLALSGLSIALLFATHDAADALVPWCDSFSPAYQVPLVITAVVLMAAHALAREGTLVHRAFPLVLAGGAGAVSFLMLSKDCLAGPFETLDPIVFNLWYLAVREGLPIWEQTSDLQAIILVPPLLGLAGSIMALRNADIPRRREAWMTLLFLQIAAFAVSLSVMRAMGFSHLLSLIGNAVLLTWLIGRAQRLTLMPARVLCTAACAIMTPIGASAVIAGLLVPGPTGPSENVVADRFRCTTYSALRGLDALPVSLLFTPLDIGAHMLVYTHHSVVATGHHRNVAGMKTVLEGLTTTPNKAWPIVAGSGAQYLVLCRGESEVGRYRKLYPKGSLIDGLADDRHPAWLVPVPMRPGETVRVYRILRPAA